MKIVFETDLEDKLKELEEEHALKSSIEWQSEIREGRDTNGYYWDYTGEKHCLKGKIAILKEMLGIIE